MTERSPAARAVWEAAMNVPEETPLGFDWVREPKAVLAAALRALATRGEAVEIRTAPGFAEIDEVIRVSDICAIADELEAQ